MVYVSQQDAKMVAVKAFRWMYQSWAAFTLGLLWLAYISVGVYWPDSFWMDVKSVRVPDGKAGQPLQVEVIRHIKRDFSARWSVQIKKIEDNGTYTVVCANASAEGNYTTRAVLPYHRTLEWWTGKSCSTLPAGRYTMTTTWIVHGGLLPDHKIEVDSPLFEVTP